LQQHGIDIEALKKDENFQRRPSKTLLKGRWKKPKKEVIRLPGLIKPFLGNWKTWANLEGLNEGKEEFKWKNFPTIPLS